MHRVSNTYVMPEMQLSWQPGFTLLRKPAKKPAPRRNRQQRFEFVVEHPQRAYRARRSPSVATFTHSGSLSNSLREHSIIVDTHRHFQGEAVEGNEAPIDPPLGTLNVKPPIRGEGSPDLGTIDVTSDPRLNSCNSEDQSPSSRPPKLTIGERNVTGPEPNAAAVSALTNIPSSLFTSVPPAIEYSSLTQRFKPILDRYNREFCMIPLTFQLRINPFRYRTDLDPEPTFLVHAVMALAGHHVSSTSSLSHRHAALQLLRQSLNAFSDPETMYSVLDTIVILFSLDETQSILGNWSTHLMGAYNLLEACGGIKTLAMSSRVEAQIGILTWWDAITSLLSREDCVFPYAYFDAILSNQYRREWDFFGLCGCPTSLVKIVMQVARLSAERQKSSLTPDFIFDNTAVSEIEQSLEQWHHIPAMTAFRDEDCMHQDQDVMHCSEAWRNGLLLYIFRIFQWEPGSSIPTRILYRARTIVDHVVSCRDVNIMSRQALLPLFFAGCELRDRSTKTEIVKLCSIWDERTRYHMFRSAIPLLEEVWTEQETKGFENVWWGQVVDKQHTSKAHPLKMRLCFG
ncbi:transcription factor domain-containing protein [Aspergillus alliaceus]|uniref:transcription factor domain-containing protein n=1 Tax=Petromyces alliaceus TaxID=209559 RepID=UPI0012A58A3A|nr:fungal-specific transcription factor domain-containing protein [Aspergillus alliaceus]KAB8230975.1 fungal-specific transcription factor domain-containing protein [Aspergillus alliaceus]